MYLYVTMNRYSLLGGKKTRGRDDGCEKEKSLGFMTLEWRNFVI